MHRILQPRPVSCVATAVVFACVLAACTTNADPSAAPGPRTGASGSPATAATTAASGAPPATAGPFPTFGARTVDFGGVGAIGFGATKADLERVGALRNSPEGCGPRLTMADELGPVFDGDSLVLIWVNPPYGTPEGVTVGSTLNEVRSAYPRTETLTPPPGSYVFPGLLLVKDDRAYLFLHDGHTVQKAIVGYTTHARRLFTNGFGQC